MMQNYLSMYKNLFGSLVVVLITLSFGVPSVTAQDINGGLSWNGWSAQGNSLDDGIWGSDATTIDYDLYYTVFEFDSTNNPVTGAPLGNSDFSGDGFADGNLIVGIGVVLNDDGSGGSDLSTEVPTLKFDLNANGYQPATSLGDSDGQTSSGTFSDQGDFNLQINGVQNVDDIHRPSFFARHDGASIVDFTQVLGSTNSPFRGFYQLDDTGPDSFQLFIDFTEIQSAPWSIAALSVPYNLTVAVPVAADITQAVLTDLPITPAGSPLPEARTVPTLSPIGLAFLAVLMMGLAFVSHRRFAKG